MLTQAQKDELLKLIEDTARDHVTEWSECGSCGGHYDCWKCGADSRYHTGDVVKEKVSEWLERNEDD